MNKRIINKNIKIYMLLCAVFSVLMIVKNWGHGINSMNATMFAFTYKYGFISRGLVGTAYALLNKIIPIELMDYSWLVIVVFALTILFYAFVLLFIYICFKRISENMDSHLMKIGFVFLCFTIPMFVGQYNFGRTDMYMAFLSMLSVMLIICRKAEWLIIIFSAMGVMVHQGYVFMFFNVILVALLYRIFTCKKKERAKYISILAISFVVASALFLYFELFSHIDGASAYDTIVGNAKQLSSGGEYHADVIDKEIMGIDLSDREVVWKKINIVQVPVFIVIMLPYIVILWKVFKGIFKGCTKGIDKLRYIVMLIGIGTMLPDLLLKVDYGRWIYAIVFYYCITWMFMMAEKDRLFEASLRDNLKYMNQVGIVSVFVLAYPIILQPLGDVYICDVTEHIVNFINDHIIHWWTYEDTHGATIRI